MLDTVKTIPKSKSTIWDVSIQKHNADRAKLHYDFRLSDGKYAYSWALRKGIPEPGNMHLAKEQWTHIPEEMNFAGIIDSGYGKGEVKLEHKGKAKIIESSPDKVKFALISKRIPEELTLIKTKDYDWLMINSTPTKTKLDIPNFKDSYKSSKDIESAIKDSDIVLEPKIDGAHAIWDLSGKFPKVFSYRPSAYTDKLIQHTYKIPGLEKIEIPKELKGVRLRGELFGVRDGKAIPSRELNAFLNSNTDKSLELQKETGTELKTIIFDVATKGLENKPYREKLETLKRVNSLIPFLQVPEVAYTDSKRELYDTIKAGKHDLTKEGVIAWNLGKPLPEKIKFKDDTEVWVREVYPMEGHPELAGGFRYSHTKNGPIVGNVGTGFTDKDRLELWNAVGRRATVSYQEKNPSGALRAPAFEKWELE